MIRNFFAVFASISWVVLTLHMGAQQAGASDLADGLALPATPPVTPKIVTGEAHTCFLFQSGKIKCWGGNSKGQLGLGNSGSRGGQGSGMGDSLLFVVLDPGEDVFAVDLVAGSEHTCALLNDGRVKCWGSNEHGQLGYWYGDLDPRGDQAGEMGDDLKAVELGVDRTAIAVAAGDSHTCAILDDGTIKCWGWNHSGQLGLGHTFARGTSEGHMENLPIVELGDGQTAIAIVAGAMHTCAILDDQTVRCWGHNYFGQLGLGDTDNRGVQADQLSGDQLIVQLGEGRTATAIAAGRLHTCAILDNGKTACWGRNEDGQLGLGIAEDRGDQSGEMAGNLLHVEFGNGRTATDISAGWSHTCAILDDGATKCWGDNADGRLGLAFPPSGRHDMVETLPVVDLGSGRSAVDISAGQRHTCVLLYDGNVKCWGWVGAGQLGIAYEMGPYPYDEDVGDSADEMGNDLPSVDLGTRERIGPQIATGNFHSCALLEDGQVKCWGRNNVGQLGLGHKMTRGDARGEMGANLLAVDLGPGLTAVRIAAGAAHNCVLFDDGSVKCWGWNESGQLGLGDDKDRGDNLGELGGELRSVDLGEGVTAVDITAGFDFSCALLDDDSIKCWGDNRFGQLAVPDAENPRGNDAGEMGEALGTVDLGDNAVPIDIQAGQYHTCALLEDGRVKCWGHNGFGQLGIGTDTHRGVDPNLMGNVLDDVDFGTDRTAIAIAVGSLHSCALLDDRSVKCWGWNGYRQLGLGDTEDRGDAAGEMGENLFAVDLGSDSDVAALAAGSSHTCALLSDGRAKCWGNNTFGRLGVGRDADTVGNLSEMGDNLPAPRLAPGLVVTDIAAGAAFTCALLEDGQVKCWGNNLDGDLGIGDAVARGEDPDDMGNNLPAVDLGEDQTILQIAAGRGHTCVLMLGGGVKCWGSNTKGQLGLGDTSPWGNAGGQMGEDLPRVDLGTGRRAIRLAGGITHTCAVLDDGSVKCWGSNAFGKLGIGDDETRGDDPGEMGEALPAVDLGVDRTAIDVTAGVQHTCALLDDGSVKCWGNNGYGQLGQGDDDDRGSQAAHMGDALLAVDLGTGARAVSITTGLFHTCALLEDGYVKCWGQNFVGQLGLGDSDHRGDDALEMGDSLDPVDLGTNYTAIAITALEYHTCATLFDGMVKCWGNNYYGGLGIGETAPRGDAEGEMGHALPSVDLGSGRTALHVATGYGHTCAILDDGTLKCWGQNDRGQLGLGDTEVRGDGPNEMGEDLDTVDLGTDLIATEIAAGSRHTCAVLEGRRVKCWGINTSGQLGLGDEAYRGREPGTMGEDLEFVDLGPIPDVGDAQGPVDGTADSDGDGLLDIWETDGIDVDADGNIDFVLDGANPNRKDIYVEIDHMPPWELNESALAAVRVAFAAAPVDGNGIALHVETGDEIEICPDADPPITLPAISISEAHDLKPCNFGSEADRADAKRIEARRMVYHYGIVVAELDGTGYDQYPENTVIQYDYSGNTGLSEPFGDDFILAIGNLPNSVAYHAPLFMHELGHNLGLDHGGPIPPDRETLTVEELIEANCKPNYISIMNYAFLFEDYVNDRRLDYSHAELAPLNECALEEDDGVQASTPPGQDSVFGAPHTVIETGVPVDWNGNGPIDAAPVIANINNLTAYGCGSSVPTAAQCAEAASTEPERYVLRGYNDWGNLKLKFRDSDYYTPGAPWDDPTGPPPMPMPREPTWQDIQVRLPLMKVWRIRPVDLAAITESTAAIALRWEKGELEDAEIAGYQIERRIANGTGQQAVVFNIGAQERAFTDQGLAPDTTYDYVVSTVTHRGVTSLPSERVSATTSARLPIIAVLMAVGGVVVLVIVAVVVLRRRAGT